METCENCGRVIGALETPHVYDGHIVCAACERILTEARTSTSIAPQNTPPESLEPAQNATPGGVIASWLQAAIAPQSRQIVLRRLVVCLAACAVLLVGLYLWLTRAMPPGKGLVATTTSSDGGSNHSVGSDRYDAGSFVGHRGAVRSIAISPDGRYLVSGGADRTLRLWDFATGTMARSAVQSDEIISVAISPDGSEIISCRDKQRQVDRWSGLLDSRPALTIDSTILRVAFSPSGKYVLACHLGGAFLIDANSGERRAFVGGETWCETFSFGADDGLCLLNGKAATFVLWDFDRGSAVTTFKGAPAWVTCVALSGDGRALSSSHYEQTVREWDSRTGQLVSKFGDKTSGNVTAVAFSPDGRRVLAARMDKTVTVYDEASGELVFACRHKAPVRCVAVSADGRIIVSGCEDGAIYVWDLESGTQLSPPPH